MFTTLSDGQLYSDKIVDNELLPVGGMGNNLNIFIKTDVDNFKPLFEQMKETAQLLMQDAEVKSFFQAHKTDLDFSLFCHMCAFNNVMRENYPDVVVTKSREHINFYHKNQNVKLSDVVANKKCACTEFAILAQAYFQRQGVPTRYVSGDVCWGEGDAFDFGPHSYIAFSNKGKNYVYDPVNPVFRKGAILPRIGECSPIKGYFNRVQSIFDDKEFGYACGDQCDYLQNLPTKSVSPLILKGKMGNFR